MNTTHNKNNKAGIAQKALSDFIWTAMPKGKVKLTGLSKYLKKSNPTDWTQTGNVTVLNANGSLDINPKSLLYSTSNLND